MYIPDGVDHPRCEYCSDLWEPPQPDARARFAEVLECTSQRGLHGKLLSFPTIGMNREVHADHLTSPSEAPSSAAESLRVLSCSQEE